MQRIFRHLWWEFETFIFSRKQYRRITSVESLTNIDDLHSDEIILVGSTKNLKWAILKCPCGCQEVIHVNLMKSHHPHWHIKRERGGTISLTPSLWVDNSRCGSHFFIWHNRVIWSAYDSERIFDLEE